MKRYLPIFACAMLLAACSDGEIVLPGANADTAASTFQSLEVTKATSDTVTQVISLDQALEMEIRVSQKKKSQWKSVCSDGQTITAEDLDNITALIDASELFSYSPEKNCEESLPGSGITINYRRADGMFNKFTSTCALDPTVEDLISALEELAAEAIPDCSVDKATPMLVLRPIFRPRLISPTFRQPQDDEDED